MARLSELLVSLLIIGTATSTTSTQSFHNLVGKAREVEAKIILGAIITLQQPFLIENQRFASTLKELELSIPAETENYEYKVFALDQTQAIVTGKAKQRGARSYTGAVSVVKNNTPGNSIAFAICETEQPSPIPPGMPLPQSSGHKIKCPFGSKQLSG